MKPWSAKQLMIVLGAVAFASCVPACGQVQDDLGGGGTPVVQPTTGPQTEAELKNQAKELFKQLAPELLSACGVGCHDNAMRFARAPTFLAGAPDVEAMYATIKKHPQLVVADPTTSVILNKEQHDGEALANILGPKGSDPRDSLNNRVQTWLTVEATAIDKKEIPTSPPVNVAAGPLEFDLSKLGLAGVKIKAVASISPSGVLKLADIKVVVGPMGDKEGAHLVVPHFIRIDAKGKRWNDVSDYFSNIDLVFPAGAETSLPPGNASFTAATSWVPFAAGDKLQVTVDKLEKGVVVSPPASTACKNVALFTSTLLPTLQGQMEGAGINCQTCHNSNRSPNLSGTAADICIEVSTRINKANPAQSVIIQKPVAGHGGGKVVDGPGFTAKWLAAIQAGAIFP
jgi:hypothetical protein